MAKTDRSSSVTNRRNDSVAISVVGRYLPPGIVFSIDIAQSGASFVRSSTATDLDVAEARAEALALSSGKPCRVSIEGAEYKVYSRGQG